MSRTAQTRTSLDHGAALRWRVAVVLLVLAGYVVLLVGGYFRLPPTDVSLSNAGDALLLAVAAMALLVVLFAVSMRRIPTRRAPLIRAVSVLLILLSTFVVFFAYFYLSLETLRPGEVPGIVTHLDALYFTVTMLATVGFGDIAPAGQLARTVATLQMLFNLVFLGFLVRTMISVGREARQARTAEAGVPSGGTG